MAAHDRGYAYYWPGPQRGVWDPPAEGRPIYHFHQATTLSQVTQGLVRAYRVMGYEPALTLAGKLIAFQRRCFNTPEGAWLTTQRGAINAHAQGHARDLMSMADYGLAVGDSELLQFVAKSYARATQSCHGGWLCGVLPVL